MNKMDFDSALRRQVMSLPELMRQQYADLEPKTHRPLHAGNLQYPAHCADRLWRQLCRAAGGEARV